MCVTGYWLPGKIKLAHVLIHITCCMYSLVLTRARAARFTYGAMGQWDNEAQFIACANESLRPGNLIMGIHKELLVHIALLAYNLQICL